MAKDIIDVEEIMTQIREEIKEKGYQLSDLSFDDIELSKDFHNDFEESYEENLKYLNSYFAVQSYLPLVGNPLFVFVKKVIRKLTFFYVNPISEQQTNFNLRLTRVINEQHAMIEELKEELENQYKYIEKLENRE
ncbi:MAG: hypothetical protein PHI41_09790 [Erysipelotrichaceae bacterium]|nr:hypothetical protein [Erysipelotrichaceae bacterium]MDD3809861.1 hypothetical protein [Erysipelotrichaceae bacterium]